MLITLTKSEVYAASFRGFNINFQHLIKKTPENYGGADHKYDACIDGFLAEMAVAKAMNVFYALVDSAKEDRDVNGVQVRSTKHKNGSLICHKEDLDNAPYLLVINRCPEFELVGWMFGRDAKNEKYWCDKANNGRFAFFVPQVDLNPTESLI